MGKELHGSILCGLLASRQGCGGGDGTRCPFSFRQSWSWELWVPPAQRGVLLVPAALASTHATPKSLRICFFLLIPSQMGKISERKEAAAFKVSPS